jgi:cell division protein FtsB
MTAMMETAARTFGARRWEPTRENVRMKLRKCYLVREMAKPLRAPLKSPANKRVKWIRYVILGAFGLGVYHILTGPSGALNLMSLRKERARMEANLDSLTQRKADLVIEKRRLEKDSAYIERVARKELGMAKPDEKVFRFVVPK